MNMHRRLLMSQLALSVGAAWFSALRQASAQSVQYTYDNAGRLIRADYSNGAIVVYRYDAAGNRIEVALTSGPPTGSLTANPTGIAPGSSSTLSWSSSQASTASIDNGVGSVTPVAGGSVSVSPSATTNYTLTLTGPGGQITRQATVTVAASAPIGTFSAAPTSISAGGSSTLSWTSTGATSASIDNGVGSVTPVSGGSIQVSPSANTTYTLTLTGPGGTTTKQAAVTVIPAPTGALSVSPTSITQGAPATLTWSSSNATSASINNGVGSVTPVAGGSVSVSPNATTTYTVTLTGPGGTTTRQATITVNPPAGIVVLNPSRTVSSLSTTTFTLAQLASTNGNAATIQSFTVSAGQGSRTIAGNGQSVSYTAPHNRGAVCEGAPPALVFGIAYVIRQTSTGQTYPGTVTITVPGQPGPQPGPNEQCP